MRLYCRYYSSLKWYTMTNQVHVFLFSLLLLIFCSCNSTTVEQDSNNSTTTSETVETPPSSADAALKVPDASDMPYDKARKIILEAGWKPLNQDEKEALAPGGVATSGSGKKLWAKGYHEVEACSGTGAGFCKFVFIGPTGQTLDVTTIGEESEDNSVFVKSISITGQE